MKKWVGISLGVHVAVFGISGSHLTPSRNFALPPKVYSVSLVSLPAPKAAPPVQTEAPKKAPESVKPKPVKKETDEAAIKPPTPKPKKKEVIKEEPKKEIPEVQEEREEEKEEEKEGSAEVSGQKGETASGPVAASALGQSGTQGTVSLDAANFGFSYYLVGLQAKIASNWFPPGSVGAPGEVLRATVHFLILEDGTIVSERIEKSSGIPYFDRSALRAVRLASPLAPLPVEFEEDELGVHFEFAHTVSVR